MAGPSPVELHSDCPSCGLESGVVEIYDPLAPACRFGVPRSATCKLCRRSEEGVFDRDPARPLVEIPANRCPSCLAELGPSSIDDRACLACNARASVVERSPSVALGTDADLCAALDDWSDRESFPSRAHLLQATFCDPDPTSLLGRIARKERLEVLVDPFANMGRRATTNEPATAPSPPVNAPAAAPVRVDPVTVSASPDTTAPPPPIAQAQPIQDAPISAPPRAIVYPLVSVVVADGEIHHAERDLVNRFLVSEGLAPLADEEFRVHTPQEVAHLVPKDRRAAVIRLMCETASVDGMPDESERRVIRAYAAAWDVPEEEVDFWMWAHETAGTSLARKLWLKIRRFVLSARWESPR
jgi:uncharacterized tellurite resistance protein B-like protein